MIYAYIRVSTKHQNIDRQYEEIKTLDIDDKYIYIDKRVFDRSSIVFKLILMRLYTMYILPLFFLSNI